MKNKKWFNGGGPFSKINRLTTDIRMIEAVKLHGIGGDGLHNAVDNSVDSDFVSGILNYQVVAAEPNK